MSGASGVVQLLRGQGEKVAKGKDLAVVYQDETYVASQEELLQVQTDLTALQYATYPESPSGTALEEQMLSSMTSLRQAASSGNFSGLADPERHLPQAGAAAGVSALVQRHHGHDPGRPPSSRAAMMSSRPTSPRRPASRLRSPGCSPPMWTATRPS